MDQRICFGKNTPATFLENLHFNRECPYRIRQKDFQNDDIAPLHYADTLEIGVCCGIRGEVIIENEQLTIDGEAVYAVPPRAVHATSFHQGSGRIYVLQVSLDALKEMINFELLFSQCGKTLSAIPHICKDFDGIYGLTQELIRLDREPIGRIRALLALFALLEQQTPRNSGVTTAALPAQNAQLYQILRWTQLHFAEEIQLEQAASVVGFSRNYFCAWFRSHTKTTYLKYLNQVRINHACRILSHAGSIDQACTDSGFRDMSYFIQTFRKMQGCTPKQYVRNCTLSTSG